MAPKEKQKAYKMLQLYAKDIYNHTRFNEKCKKNGKGQTPYVIDVTYIDKEGNERLSPLFRASMGDNLDLYHLEDIMREENNAQPREKDEELKYAVKRIKLLNNDTKTKRYETIIPNFISVTFDGTSHEYEKAYSDYDNNWKVYVKNGTNIKPSFEEFNNTDSVIINDDKVVAVRTNFEINEEQDLTKYGFKVVPMYDKTKKSYKYTQGNSDLYVLKEYAESHDYNYFEDKLDEGVYIENNEIIAVKTNYKVTKENGMVSDSKYFEFNKRSKKYYFKNTTSNEKDVYINLGPSFIEYETNKPEIYVKRGLRMRYDELITKLDDSVYIENGEVFAVKTCTTIKNENELVSKSKYFKYDSDKKCYYHKNYTKTDVGSQELRQDIYVNGFSVYIFGKKVKYERYKRSASNARSGNCIFINEKYKDVMREWTYLGPEFAKDRKANEEMPVELEAYKSLSLSTLIDTIKIDPYSILILKDKESIFKEKCVSVKIEDELLTAEEKTVDITNTIWDGEGLLDESVFKENHYEDKGMLLLRNRYFKCCAFNTKLQEWFKANNITDISQLNGYVYEQGGHPEDKPRKVSIEDIKLVVTYSSLKFIKFREEDTDFNNIYCINYWKNKVGDTFGVVKTDKPTKYFKGKVTRTSYQFLNTLGMTEKDIKNLSLQTSDYLKLIKNEPAVLKYHLSCQLNLDASDLEFDDDNDYSDNQKTGSFLNYKRRLAYELLSINNDFIKARILSDIKSDIVSDFKDDFKKGKVFVPGTFSTLFGNGYELLHSTIKPAYLIIDKDYDMNNVYNLKLKKGEIMCKRFEEYDEVCCVRFPHITMGNVYTAKNKIVDEYNRWFNLTPEIACVNAIGENIQNRLNGMDYDGDTMMITNYDPIVKAAKKYYYDFKVPVYEKQDGDIGIDQVDSSKLYDIDYLISNNEVGPITNLSQWLNSILWDMYNEDNSKGFDMELYYKICKLAILCGMEIDKAKRNYKVNAIKVMNSIIAEIEDKYKNKPKFMGKISKFKNKNADIDLDDYAEYNTSMGYIDRFKFDDIKNENQGWGEPDLLEFINKDEINTWSAEYNKKKDELIEELTVLIDKINDINKGDKKEIISKTYEALDNYCDYAIKNKLASHPYTSNLFFKEDISTKFKDDEGIKDVEKFRDKLYLVFLYVLYKTPAKNAACNNMLQQLFEKKCNQQKLVEDPKGDFKLFGNKYKIA